MAVLLEDYASSPGRGGEGQKTKILDFICILLC